MSLSTQYSTGTYVGRVAEIKSQSIVEIRVSDRDIGEVCAVYPQVALTSCSADSGRVNYGGRLSCTVVFTDEGGKLCRMQKGAEFTHYADDDCLAPAHVTQCALSCEKVQIKRDGSSFVIAVVVGAEIQVFAAAERSYLETAEGAIVRRENAKLLTAVTFSGESEVEDDFDCNAEDVLIPAAEALVTDCDCRAGVVQVGGEIFLSMLAVRDGKPVCLDRIIPYKCEIACEQALLSRKAVCRAEIKEIGVNARVNEERGKCDVELVVQLSFTGRYYDEEETSLITDAFSPENKLQLGFASETACPCTEIKVYSERVSGLCASKAKLDYTCSFMAAALPKAEFTRSGDGIEGSVSATLLYEQNGDIRSTEVNLPFAVSLKGLNENCTEISVAVCGVNIRQRAEGECDAEAVLKICAADCEKSEVKYVTDLTEGEPQCVNQSALSVYVPAAGDGLWETAKKLLQSPEQIEATNPELAFPLSGKERILVFRPRTN